MKLTEELLKEIKKSKEVYSGAEGVVTLYKNLALKEYLWGEEQSKLDDYKKYANKLRQEKAVNTPRIYDTLTMDDNGEEVQCVLMERVKGSPVFAESFIYLKKTVPKLTGMDPEKASYLIYPALKRVYSRYIAEKLSDGSQMLFDKFVENVIEVNKSSFFEIDNYGENIYFDNKSGFSLIDLNFNHNKTKDTNSAIENKTLQIGFNYIDRLYYDINQYGINPKCTKYLNEVIDKTIKACNKCNISNETINRNFGKNDYTFNKR